MISNYRLGDRNFPETKFFFPKSVTTGTSTLDNIAAETFGCGAQKSTNTAGLNARVSDITLEETRQAIADRTGVIWECIGRRAEDSGYVYRFKMRPEYDDLTPRNPVAKVLAAQAATQASLEAYPAIELVGGLIVPSSGLEKLGNFRQDTQSLMEQLGYNVSIGRDGVFVEYPDGEALRGKWNILREKLKVSRPGLQLRELKIISNDSTSDWEFIEAYLHGDFLISTKHEFVHDHQSHVVPTLKLMLNSEEGRLKYDDLKNELVGPVKSVCSRLLAARGLIDRALQKGVTQVFIQNYGTIQIPLEELKRHMPKIEAALAIIVDGLSSACGKVRPDEEPFNENDLLGEMWNLESPLFALKDELARINPQQNYDFFAEEYFAARFPRGEYTYKTQYIWLGLLELEQMNLE